MHADIKHIEDLSLNAWPSHQIQYYDGWLLRFSYFYTHRTNCVEQAGPSTLPLGEKITYCESEYRKWGTPAVFKITPLVDPSFDRLLASRGYLTEHVTQVMTRTLPGAAPLPEGTAPADVPPPGDGSAPADVPPLPEGSALPEVPPLPEGIGLSCGRFISDRWIEALFALKHTTNIMHRKVVPSMYHAIPKETVCVSALHGSTIIGTGLGILDRGYVGVYAIHVHPSFRRQHIASAIVSTILREGAARGASAAYLQVVAGNDAAHRFYLGSGFSDFYSYSFRVR